MSGPRSANRNQRNAPCPCGSGLKRKHCCSVVERIDAFGLSMEIVRVTEAQAREIELLMRVVNEIQRQGHRIEAHECPICDYLAQEGLKGE